MSIFRPICADCIDKYYAGSLAANPGQGLCVYCNVYGNVYHLRPGAVKKKRLPLEAKDCLKRMYVIDYVDVNFPKAYNSNQMFEGTIEEIMARLKKFRSEAEYGGFTHVHFNFESDYFRADYCPQGVRLERDDEFKQRTARIRLRRKRRKEKLDGKRNKHGSTQRVEAESRPPS